MTKFASMIESNYLKQSDLDEFDDQECVVTIVKIGQKNIGRENEDIDMKWLVKFKEFTKPMVLNSTNIQLLSKATGAESTEEAIGKQVIVYVDPNVSFGGKLVGGLRIKAIRSSKPKPQPKQSEDNFEDSKMPGRFTDDKDIPF
jgi:hypothetical protein